MNFEDMLIEALGHMMETKNSKAPTPEQLMQMLAQARQRGKTEDMQTTFRNPGISSAMPQRPLSPG